MSLTEAVSAYRAPDSRFEELKGLALEMSRYYIKNFIAALNGIRSAGNLWIRNVEASDKKEYAFATVQKIKDCYAAIPFDTLEGKVQFEPLFQVRKMLPRLESVVKEVFQNRSEDARQQLRQVTTEIATIGKKYFATLMSILDEITTYIGGGNFRSEVLQRLNHNQI